MVKDQQKHLNDIFSALSDATRRSILSELLENNQTVSQIAAGFPISMAMVSKHLKILSQAGLVSQVKQGREKICQLTPETFSIASDYLTGFGQLSAQEFDELETELFALGLIDE